MSETTQGYLGIGNENTKINLGFQSVLNYIREHARSERQKGDYFERLMQKYFTEDPDYKAQFSEVYLWKEWAQRQTEFDGTDKASQKRHIRMLSTAEHRWGGLSTATKSHHRKRTTVSSMTQTAGLKTPATSSQQ